MSPLQLVSQVVQTPQELERKKRNGTARQVRQEKNSFFLVLFFFFDNFWPGPVRENPSTPMERAP